MAPLISFRAGRCERRPGTNWVDPQPAKGLVSLEQSNDDGLIHCQLALRSVSSDKTILTLCVMTVQYRDLESSSTIDDLILFPGDAALLRIPSDSGRIYVLKFTSSSARHFYWMQDVEDSQDARRTARINQLIDDPDANEADLVAPDVASSQTAAASQQDATMDGAEPSSPAAGDQGAVDASESVAVPGMSNVTAAQMAQLQALLAQSAQASQGGVGVMPQQSSLSLADILSPARLLALLSISPQLAESLYPFLPTESDTVPHDTGTLQRILSAPELRKSARSLDQALTSGALGPLAASLNLSEDETFGVEAYLRGVQRLGDAERETNSGALREDA